MLIFVFILSDLSKGQPNYRAGLDKDLIKYIGKSGLKEIIYISCNPQTLARDISRLEKQGYKLEKIKAVDMFPQTMHVETVVLMSRVKD